MGNDLLSLSLDEIIASRSRSRGRGGSRGMRGNRRGGRGLFRGRGGRIQKRGVGLQSPGGGFGFRSNFRGFRRGRGQRQGGIRGGRGSLNRSRLGGVSIRGSAANLSLATGRRGTGAVRGRKQLVRPSFNSRNNVSIGAQNLAIQRRRNAGGRLQRSPKAPVMLQGAGLLTRKRLQLVKQALAIAQGKKRIGTPRNYSSGNQPLSRSPSSSNLTVNIANELGQQLPQWRQRNLNDGASMAFTVDGGGGSPGGRRRLDRSSIVHQQVLNPRLQAEIAQIQQRGSSFTPAKQDYRHHSEIPSVSSTPLAAMGTRQSLSDRFASTRVVL
ncbi:unnamed protein product [Darwinula stevensoni]|uniref:Uncharacterized protein n=1 Tax=Darwinula stevensoni TaxID=69355 RepID=A0A7R9A9L3_9CRUS|nr:unnamed protein product [Darwinula stevensoni]CAG0897545.1 unnamed protein product [Darwinula stevensoni]